MKRMCVGISLAALMLLSACTGKPAGEAPSGVYYDITGVDPAETVLVLDGNEIPAELYCYWAAFNCSALEYQLKMYHDYFGMYEEVFQDDGTIDWNAKFPSSDMTLNQYAKDMAEDTVFFYAAIENLADQYGVTLTEENEAAIDEEMEGMKESLGGEEEFQNYLEETGLSVDNLRRVMSATSLLDGLMELAGQEGSEIYLDPAKYGDYLGYTDYIFLSTDGLSEDEAAAKRQTAGDILAQLEQAEDKDARFAELATEYNEDTNRGETGYFYTPGTLPAAVEEAAAALEPGAVSELVESEEGLYLVLGKSLEEGLAGDPQQTDAVLQNYVVELVNTYQEEMEVERRGTLTDMEMGEFYQKYLDEMDQRALDDATEILDGAATSTEPQS